jgi:hypothetical protein
MVVLWVFPSATLIWLGSSLFFSKQHPNKSKSNQLKTNNNSTT